MCGRYLLKITPALEEYFGVQWEGAKSSFNIAPTSMVPVVLPGASGSRVGAIVRWGLVPPWAFGDMAKAKRYSLFNARFDEIAEKRSYKGAWQKGQRALQPASGFYEWQLQGKTKVPYYIGIADREQFAFAAIWEESSSPDRSVVSVAHLTLPAEPGSQVWNIHNTGDHPHRTPAILAREDEDAWLHGTTEQAIAVLRPYQNDLTVSWPVAPRVGNVRNNDEQLIRAVD